MTNPKEMWKDCLDKKGTSFGISQTPLPIFRTNLYGVPFIGTGTKHFGMQNWYVPFPYPYQGTGTNSYQHFGMQPLAQSQTASVSLVAYAESVIAIDHKSQITLNVINTT